MQARAVMPHFREECHERWELGQLLIEPLVVAADFGDFIDFTRIAPIAGERDDDVPSGFAEAAFGDLRVQSMLKRAGGEGLGVLFWNGMEEVADLLEALAGSLQVGEALIAVG